MTLKRKNRPVRWGLRPGRAASRATWSSPRYFSVPQERVAEIGPEAALDELLEFARHLGYQPVRDVRKRFFRNEGAIPDAG